MFWVGIEAGWQKPNFYFFEMARGSPLIGPDPVTKYGTPRKVGNTGLHLRTRSDPVWIPNKLLASNISGSDPIYLDLVVVLLASRFSLTCALYETIHLLPRFHRAAKPLGDVRKRYLTPSCVGSGGIIERTCSLTGSSGGEERGFGERRFLFFSGLHLCA